MGWIELLWINIYLIYWISIFLIIVWKTTILPLRLHNESSVSCFVKPLTVCHQNAKENLLLWEARQASAVSALPLCVVSVLQSQSCDFVFSSDCCRRAQRDGWGGDRLTCWWPAPEDADWHETKPQRSQLLCSVKQIFFFIFQIIIVIFDYGDSQNDKILKLHSTGGKHRGPFFTHRAPSVFVGQVLP